MSTVRLFTSGGLSVMICCVQRSPVALQWIRVVRVLPGMQLHHCSLDGWVASHSFIINWRTAHIHFLCTTVSCPVFKDLKQVSCPQERYWSADWARWNQHPWVSTVGSLNRIFGTLWILQYSSTTGWDSGWQFKFEVEHDGLCPSFSHWTSFPVQALCGLHIGWHLAA